MTKHKKSKLRRQSRTRRRRSRQQRKRTIKRGGMFRSGHKAVSTARSIIRTTLYHDIIPLLTQYRHYLLTKEAPKASDGFIVPHGDKYYTLFEGIEIDEGTKESIKNWKDDLNDPPKTLEKLKSLYDKVTAGLEKKHNKQGQIVQEQNKAFQSPNSSLTGILQITPLQRPQEQVSPEQASSESPFAHTPTSLRYPHFQTPTAKRRNGNDIGDVTPTPPKLRQDEKAPKSVINPYDDLYVQGYGVTLFPNDKNTTPFTSPVRQSPPKLQRTNRKDQSFPLSPSRRLVLP
jgi:hypothetical protein